MHNSLKEREFFENFCAVAELHPNARDITSGLIFWFILYNSWIIFWWPSEFLKWMSDSPFWKLLDRNIPKRNTNAGQRRCIHWWMPDTIYSNAGAWCLSFEPAHKMLPLLLNLGDILNKHWTLYIWHQFIDHSSIWLLCIAIWYQAFSKARHICSTVSKWNMLHNSLKTVITAAFIFEIQNAVVIEPIKWMERVLEEIVHASIQKSMNAIKFSPNYLGDGHKLQI